MLDQTLHAYFKTWMELYKRGAVRPVTFQKYENTHNHIRLLAPKLKLSELDRSSYQELLNLYAQTHEKQTVHDFHHLIKAAILDAKDEGLVVGNPVRKAIIKGRTPAQKRVKYLSQFELQGLLVNLELTTDVSWDWFIYLIVKTGLRFAEALGVTPKDFDFQRRQLKIDKTWNYKERPGSFQQTKTDASHRVLGLDVRTADYFQSLIGGLPADRPIFVKGHIFNATVNDRLTRLCRKASVPGITIHGLRHTHASVLLYAGVSIASVARRLGHTNMTTTQQVYLHIIKELEEREERIIAEFLGKL